MFRAHLCDHRCTVRRREKRFARGSIPSESGARFGGIDVGMYTLTLLAQKGGTGKTTLAINLAVVAETEGRRAVLIDLDPQASAAGWGDHREEDSPVVAAVPAARLDGALGAARAHGADLAVIDTAPHSEGSALAAARAADLALIPLRPAILDLRAVGTTADICTLAGGRAAVVLNQTPPRGPVPDQAAAALAERNLEVAPHRVGARVAFAHSLTTGRGVVEYEPRGKAAAEIRQLFTWTWEQLAS